MAVLAGLGFGLFQTLNRRAVDGMDLLPGDLHPTAGLDCCVGFVSLLTVDMSLLFTALSARCSIFPQPVFSTFLLAGHY